MDIGSKRQTMVVWSGVAILVGMLTIILTAKYLKLLEGIEYREIKTALIVVIVATSLILFFTLFNLVAMWLNVEFFKRVYYSIIGCSILLILFSVVMIAVIELEYIDLFSSSATNSDTEYLAIMSGVTYLRTVVFKNIPLFLICASSCNVVVAEKALKIMEYKEEMAEESVQDDAEDESLANINNVKNMKNKIKQVKKEMKVKKLEKEYNKLMNDMNPVNSETIQNQDENNKKESE